MANTLATFEKIVKETIGFCALESSSAQDAMEFVCKQIHHNCENYEWVGFYLCSTQEKDMLILGPYEGEVTDHVKIPFGKGICGQAAVNQETFLIDDVTKEDNYIACSIHVKSEIVVPMFKNQTMIGQIDIDSSVINAFSSYDQIFLEKICQIIAEKF